MAMEYGPIDSGQFKVVIFERGQATKASGEPLSPELTRMLMADVLEADTEVFGTYAEFTNDEYERSLLVNGAIAAVFNDRLELRAKAGLMVGGVGRVAVANYEKSLPSGFAHQEGYLTKPDAQRKGLQMHLLRALEMVGRHQRGINTFTAAFEPFNVTSMRNFVRAGYVPGIVFDPHYLKIPDQDQKDPCFVALKVGDKPVEFNPRLIDYIDVTEENSPKTTSDITRLMDDGNVCVAVDYLPSDKDHDGIGARNIFVPLRTLEPEVASKIRNMQTQITERL